MTSVTSPSSPDDGFRAQPGRARNQGITTAKSVPGMLLERRVGGFGFMLANRYRGGAGPSFSSYMRSAEHSRDNIRFLSSNVTHRIAVPESSNVHIACARYSASREGTVAIGLDNGTVAVYMPVRVVGRSTLTNMEASSSCDGSLGGERLLDLCWGCDDNHIVSVGGGTGVAVVHDVATRRVRREMKVQTGTVKRVAANPVDGNTYASASRDGNVALWDVRAAMPVYNLLRDAHVRPQLVRQRYREHAVPSFHDDKQTLLRYRGLEPGRTSHTVTNVVYQHDGRSLITAGSGDGLVKIWDLRALRSSRKCPKYVSPAQTLSPAQGDDAGTPRRRQEEPSAALEDWSSWTKSLRGVVDVKLDGTGTRLLVAYMRGAVCVYDLAGADFGRRHPRHLGGVRIEHFEQRVCWGADGTYVHAADHEGLKTWFAAGGWRSPSMHDFTPRVDDSFGGLSSVEAASGGRLMHWVGGELHLLRMQHCTSGGGLPETSSFSPRWQQEHAAPRMLTPATEIRGTGSLWCSGAAAQFRVAEYKRLQRAATAQHEGEAHSRMFKRRRRSYSL